MDTIEYIDAYFNHALGEGEKAEFEEKCRVDEAFAKEVVFYIEARQALKNNLLEQKKQEWQTTPEEDLPSIPVIKKSFTARYIVYLAAACLVLAASVYLFETNVSARQMANNYINNNYESLSQTMDASRDSIQLGIAAYNNKDYDKALQLFAGVERIDAANSDAKKYTGLTYFKKKDYNNALQQFDNLSRMKGLYSNPGDFLKAVTLLERNKPGDKDEAKKLLQKVVNENEDGKETATEWLKKM